MSLENYGYKQELKRVLTFKDLVIYGLIFMVPIAPFGVFGYILDQSQGMIALTYLIGMVAMFFTAISYWSMSKSLPIAGSVFSYAHHGIHPVAGFFTGWLILLDYILVPSLLYIVSANALHDFLPDIPGTVWIVFFVVANSLINCLGVEFTAKATKIILIFELIVLAIFVALGAKDLWLSDHSSFTLMPLYDSDNFSFGLIFGGVSIAVLSFLGFDGISTLSEEVKGDQNTVGKASLTALLVIGVLFIVQTWIAADLLRNMAINNVDTAFYDAAFIAGGASLKTITLFATIISWGLANALVAQSAVSRILFAMSRDDLLPKCFAKVHDKYKTPVVSIFFIAVISIISGLYFSDKLDDLTRLVNFGALTCFVMLHISVIVFYVFKKRQYNVVLHIIFPVLGLLIIAYVIYEMDVTAKLLGLSWLAVGIVYYLVLRFVLQKKINLNIE
ncbi:amino acid/polyamine/organocation transporter (APC superfamily) [Orbus hercynius]|uniref:Amino acid/polyamine/organocation transporter (APC superfamily) n=1 Tax=Orbus hercynius TaxID=593135 RepID=A0A495RBE7_9GAMM|nr:APC family permease [Orbus hercynius]RKS84807.1 amino acid/polyamine/organocation transporter (APC superfamily) [Orbus hercynius]